MTLKKAKKRQKALKYYRQIFTIQIQSDPIRPSITHQTPRKRSSSIVYRDRASLPDTMAGGTRGASSEQITIPQSSLQTPLLLDS
jgi:hypothetical protein